MAPAAGSTPRPALPEVTGHGTGGGRRDHVPAAGAPARSTGLPGYRVTVTVACRVTPLTVIATVTCPWRSPVSVPLEGWSAATSRARAAERAPTCRFDEPAQAPDTG